ncbi:MAG: cytochrome c biogenesis protein CcsA [Fimbriimonas sp.]
MNNLFRAFFALVMGAVTVWSFYVPPARNFQRPDLARIFLWHFPCPMIATSLLLFGAWFSFKFLKTRERQWDVRANAAHELSYVFSLLTMATGMLFSKMEWGAWWQWDPRQTSFLLVLLIYAALFALRGAHPDADRRAANSSAYVLAALLPALFLIFVFPRLPQVESFHPTNSIMSGQIKGQYGYAVTTMIVLLSLVSGWLYRLRVRAGLLELRLENLDGQHPSDRSDPAPSGVVRPVRLPSEN